MKKLSLLLAGLVLCGILAACGDQDVSSSPSQGASASLPASTPASESSKETDIDIIYRGTVTQLSDEQITVEQVSGYDYGQPSIVFHIDDNTALPAGDESVPLAEGAYVEVRYSGALTRSLPPQGTALSVQVVAPAADAAIVNGTIQTVEVTDTGYTIGLLSFQSAQLAASRGEIPSFQDQIILLVPVDALEGGLTEADLVEGTEVCAVTTGIAALSLPPQMPVHALLPYTLPEAAADESPPQA